MGSSSPLRRSAEVVQHASVELVTAVAQQVRGVGMPVAATCSVATPVILIHGWGAGVGAFRTGRYHLTNSGLDGVYAFSYASVISTLDSVVASLDEYVRQVVERHGVGAHLVGWSLGGILASAVDVCCGRGGDGTVTSVATICTPHHGATLVDRLGVVGRCTDIGRALQPNSAYLHALASGRDARTVRDRYHTVSATDDWIVSDASSRITAVGHTAVANAGHFSVLEREVTWQAIVTHITQAQSRLEHASDPERDRVNATGTW